MYLHRKYVFTQEVCTHAGSMASHRKYTLIQEVCTYVRSMHSQWTYIIIIIIIIMCTYSLVRGVGVGFSLETRGRKTLEVEGTGLDNGET